jgi:aspartate/glutamate racemase
MNTASKIVNNTELVIVELDFNSRVYVQRVIYSFMKNNKLTALQTSTYDQLIDLMQDATIWASANERAILAYLVSKDLNRKDITEAQRENVKRVYQAIAKEGK